MINTMAFAGHGARGRRIITLPRNKAEGSGAFFPIRKPHAVRPKEWTS